MVVNLEHGCVETLLCLPSTVDELLFTIPTPLKTLLKAINAFLYFGNEVCIFFSEDGLLVKLLLLKVDTVFELGSLLHPIPSKDKAFIRGRLVF